MKKIGLLLAATFCLVTGSARAYDYPLFTADDYSGWSPTETQALWDSEYADYHIQDIWGEDVIPIMAPDAIGYVICLCLIDCGTADDGTEIISVGICPYNKDTQLVWPE